MAKAVVGNPDLDRDVVQRFVQARDAVRAAVAEVLGNESVIRNLGQDSLDDIETSVRETRIDTDRVLLVFARVRAIRLRQVIGGMLGSMSKRLAALEEAITAPDAGPKAEVTESKVITAPNSDPVTEHIEPQAPPLVPSFGEEAGSLPAGEVTE